MDEISAYIVTFNCGREFINVDTFASQLFDGLSHPILPDLVVLALQEIAPVGPSLIGGSFLVPYFTKFNTAVQKAAQKLVSEHDGLPMYTAIAAKNLGMTAIMVFARDPEMIQDLETGGVGFGVSEMGDKGAVGTRFTYGIDDASTGLTFVAAHLAAGEGALERRNRDWGSLVRGLVFSSAAQGGTAISLSDPSEEDPLLSIHRNDGSIYNPTYHLFVAGDLNYRTSTMSPAPNDHIELFPQPRHDKSSPQHYKSLFENDQLNQERAAGRTLQGLIEAPVTFPPTYKYEVVEPFLTPDEDLERWQWATHRWPSWCDRILYLDLPDWMNWRYPKAKITTQRYTALPLQPTTDHRAVTLEVKIPLIPISQPDDHEEGESSDVRVEPPYHTDINWKTRRDKARRLELLSGFITYFTTTGEGATVLLALIGGVVGAVFAFRAVLL